MFKSTRKFIGVYTILAIFCAVLIVLFITLRYSLALPEEVAKIPVDVLITLLAATLAGAFTLAGVEITMKEQIKNKFISEFPIKIFHLDQLNEYIDEMLNTLNEDNYFLLATQRDYFKESLTIATEIDGFVYYKVRQAHMDFSSIVSKMYTGDEKLIMLDNWQVWHVIKGKEEELEKSMEQLRIIVGDLNLITVQYRENFISHYDKYIDGSIYKKVNE